MFLRLSFNPSILTISLYYRESFKENVRIFIFLITEDFQGVLHVTTTNFNRTKVFNLRTFGN